MRRRLALAATLATALLGGAAAPAAQADQSTNVHVISQLSALKSAISINFIGTTMFVSTAAGLFSYDVSDPADPQLLGSLPMYIWENEDVDVDPVRKLLFVSRDPRGFTSPAVPGSAFPYGAVQIIDVSDPRLMTERAQFLLPAGHTTTCINRCDFLWTAGPVASTTTQPADWEGRPIFATDVRDPDHPVPCPAPIDTDHDDGKTGYVHDVQVDAAGVAWVTGQGGVRGYWTEGRHYNPVSGTVETATACAPVPYAGAGSPESATPSRFMHNAWRDYIPGADQAPPAAAPKRPKAAKKRPARKHAAKKRPAKKKTHHAKRHHAKAKARAAALAPVTPTGVPRNDVLLATEENVVTDCPTAGRFATYDLRGTLNGEGFAKATAPTARMKVLDTWTPESKPGSTGCASSHYFTSNGAGITANAFYTQGVRFLDVSDPTHIRQIGYYVNPDSDTWAAYFHGGYVYVADFQRGVEVLKLDATAGQSRTVRAPILQRSTTSPLRFSASLFGGLCPLTIP